MRNISFTSISNIKILQWLHQIVWYDIERTQIEWCMMWINSDWVLPFICFRSSEIWILIECANDSNFVMLFVISQLAWCLFIGKRGHPHYDLQVHSRLNSTVKFSKPLDHVTVHVSRYWLWFIYNFNVIRSLSLCRCSSFYYY